jgi:ribosomal protein S13
MNPKHILDKLIPFRRKVFDLEKFNIYQLLFQRFGLGKWLSYTLLSHCAVHPSVNIRTFNDNLLNGYMKLALSKNQNSVDMFLQRNMIAKISRNVKLYNYRGSRYIEYLPMNGQRRRSNAITCKRVRPYTTKHLSSFQRRKQNI